MTIIAMQAYKAAKKAAKAAAADANAIVKVAFTDAAKEVFEKFPELTSFSWSQYTPYFNDGDVCTFQCNVDYPTLTFTDETEVNTNMGEGDAESRSKEIEAVRSFLGQFDNVDYETMFEDHVTVTITREGKITVEDYEHC